MVERLNPLDASFLYLEEPATPMHVGGLLVLDAPPGGLDALAALVEARLPLVPRYRQRVAEVPGHLADPVWVDDRDFDLALPPAALPAAAAGHRGAAAGPGVAARVPAAGPQPPPVGGRTSSRA